MEQRTVVITGASDGIGAAAAIASGAYVLAMFLTAFLIEAMPRATELLVFRIVALFGLFWHPLTVRDWLFDRDPEQWALDRVGFDPWVGALVITVIAAGTAVIAHRRYRRDF